MCIYIKKHFINPEIKITTNKDVSKQANSNESHQIAYYLQEENL